jgi:NAD(P)-dependent dehydrogenase (short-subunit alcohol dehydrogenase family)
MCNILENKLVVITGGSGLMGKEFAKAVVENGGIAIIADMAVRAGEKCIEALKEELKSDKIEFIAVDITSKKCINSMIEFLAGKYGRIDALVNNAYPRNKNYGKLLEDVTYKDFCENVSMHLGGYFLTSQQVGLFFRKQGYGNIINIASIYGVVPPRFEIYKDCAMTMPVEYAVIKSGVLHLTKYMAKYFKGSNIRVNAISPGGILSGQPGNFLEKYNNCCLSKGMLDAQDIKGTLVYLLSDGSLYVNGQNIIVDDGFVL